MEERAEAGVVRAVRVTTIVIGTVAFAALLVVVNYPYLISLIP